MGPINISAVYCPPKHNIKEEMFTRFFNTLGHKYITVGDWNSKHSNWGARLTTTHGRELKKCIDHLNLITLSTGEPTYWPTDPNRMPDLLDFFITKGLSHIYLDIESSLDTSSDHSPIIGTFSVSVIHKEQKMTLYNRKTDWYAFAEYLEEHIDLKVKFKTDRDVNEAAFYVTNKIQEAAWRSTPATTLLPPCNINIPMEIRL